LLNRAGSSHTIPDEIGAANGPGPSDEKT
jgi:hypothetical protein